MHIDAFLDELNLRGRMLSIIPTDDMDSPRDKPPVGGCLISSLQAALDGGTLLFTEGTKGCAGACWGFGLRDGLPEIKGGFGHFLTSGRGEGFPPGERVKESIEVAEAMIAAQPADVLGGHRAIRVKPYDAADDAAVVTWLANPDQLSALIHLFTYRAAAYDMVIAPMSSGCASIFRIPLGEAMRERPRGVIGNVDIFSRPHFPADTFFFSVPLAFLRQMLADADECFFHSPIWKGVRGRIHADT